MGMELWTPSSGEASANLPDREQAALWADEGVRPSIPGFLENFPYISYTAGDALAIKVFEQGDGVFAADSSQLLEFRNVNFC